MNSARLLRLLPAAVLAALVLAACDVIPPPQADPTRYFVLTSPTPASADSPAPSGGLRIGLRAVELPGYLHSPDMVVRRGENELALEDYDRWAEPLDAAIGRVIRERLRQDPAVARLFSQPFPLDTDRDYDVVVSIRRCEGDAGSAVFEASFEIATAGANPRIVARRTYVAPAASWDGHDFGRLAALLSADVDSLAREIASALPAPGAP